MDNVALLSDTQTRKDNLKGFPLCSLANVVNWTKKMKMWLMRKRRNPLGLEEKPPRPTMQLLTSARSIQVNWRSGRTHGYLHQCNLRISFKRTRFLEMVEQYMFEKDILPAADP